MNQIKPKLMLDQRKEKRNKVLMFIFAAVFFLIVFATQGQTMKIERWGATIPSGTVITKSPSYPLMFRVLNSKDTLFLSAVADSIGNNVYSIALYSYGSINTKLADKGIKIWYSDLSVDEFVVGEFNKKEQYIKYNIKGNSLSNLFHKELLAIELNPIMYCENFSHKNYFMEFFSKYDK